jgi:hypothetical protein
MFDKRHYRNYPEFKDSLLSEEEAMAKADVPEAQEDVRKRARNLGNKKTKNASGRRWWDQR